ncbi:hypothetical protein [Hymenobacter sp. 102]|uniref:hypothetical protein n=1 Tax=Hymenobacter sp. 102 TaxID=3403152 RepID=UPI003CF6E165
MRHESAVTLLYRPVNQAELDLIAASGWQAFPPCLPEQPFFYPVLHEQYAAQIAHEWNVPDYDVCYVLRFAVEADYADLFPVQDMGSRKYQQLRVPAGELEEFNRHIIGQIEVVSIPEA